MLLVSGKTAEYKYQLLRHSLKESRNTKLMCKVYKTSNCTQENIYSHDNLFSSAFFE